MGILLRRRSAVLISIGIMVAVEVSCVPHKLSTSQHLQGSTNT